VTQLVASLVVLLASFADPDVGLDALEGPPRRIENATVLKLRKWP
jgi:hypothetical protein